LVGLEKRSASRIILVALRFNDNEFSPAMFCIGPGSPIPSKLRADIDIGLRSLGQDEVLSNGLVFDSKSGAPAVSYNLGCASSAERMVHVAAASTMVLVACILLLLL